MVAPPPHFIKSMPISCWPAPPRGPSKLRRTHAGSVHLRDHFDVCPSKRDPTADCRHGARIRAHSPRRLPPRQTARQLDVVIPALDDRFRPAAFAFSMLHSIRQVLTVFSSALFPAGDFSS